MIVAVAISTLSAGTAAAQSAGTPQVEISILPGGATFFTEGDSGAPSFQTYAPTGSVTVNANRFVGIEAEVGGNIGLDQDLEFTAARFRRPLPTCCRRTRISSSIYGVAIREWCHT